MKLILSQNITNKPIPLDLTHIFHPSISSCDRCLFLPFLISSKTNKQTKQFYNCLSQHSPFSCFLNGLNFNTNQCIHSLQMCNEKQHLHTSCTYVVRFNTFCTASFKNSLSAKPPRDRIIKQSEQKCDA